jgi:hypothetical protein
MKKSLLIVALLISGINSYAQFPVDSATHQIVYTEIYRVDSVNAKDLYLRAKQWFASAYNSSKAVIENDDRESNTIFAKPSMTVTCTMLGSTSNMGTVDYSITVACKDEKYRVVVTDFYFHGSYASGNLLDMNDSKQGYRKKDWEAAKRQVNENIRALIVNLKSGMQKKLLTSSKDW